MKTLLRCFLVCALLAAHLFYVQAAHAATFTVTNRADTNDGVCNVHCSLREAITAANNLAGNDTIVFASTVTGNIELSGRQIDITGGVDLRGPGAKKLNIRRATGFMAVFYTFAAENEVTISGLSFNGSNVGSDEGGAIMNSKRLTVRDCYFSNNSARLGGAISNRGQLLLENCTFSQNRADSGGALQTGLAESVTAMLRNCTLSGNISVFGGGISNSMGELSIDHCTITGNSMPVQMGGGSGVWASPFESPVQVSNSIIAGNFTDGNLGDVDSSPDAVAFQSNGYNVIGVGNAADNFNNNDQTGVTDPLLLPLADNGGPTPTHALHLGSPAISAGNPNFAPPPSFDQRGAGFPRVRNGRLDVGAYESETRLALTINDVTVSEGNPAQGTPGETNATFQVRLSIPSTQTVTVNAITANGTAKAPGDYTSGGATLSFAPGEISKTFSVPVTGDLLDEADEVFYVILSSPVNAPILRGRGIGTIQDDDAAPTISIDDISVKEYNSGQTTAALRLRLSAPSGQVVRVNYETSSGTATAGSDFESVATTTVAFNTGGLYAYARVLINGDLLNESNETFLVSLSSPLNATIADYRGVGTILNDDSAPALTINDVSIAEGNTGTKNLTFTVSLSKASGQTVTVNYATANGIARSGSDYEAENGVLRFIPDTGLTRQISIPIYGDTLVEGDETFYILLSSAINASIGRGRGTGTIINDDTSGLTN
jgi:CSLREA domain-containing protein